MSKNLTVCFIAVYRENLMLAKYDPTQTGSTYDHYFQSLYTKGKLTEPRLFQSLAGHRVGIGHRDNGMNVVLVVDGNISAKAMHDSIEQIWSGVQVKNPRTWLTASQLGLNDSCASLFQDTKRRIESPTFAKVAIVEDNLEATVEQGKANLETALLRGQNLDSVNTSSQHVAALARDYRRAAVDIKCRMLWERIRWIVLGVAIALFLIFLIVLVACGGFKFSRCRKADK